jgi:hypothetical protein
MVERQSNIWWRRVLVADLFFYNLANFFFAYLPQNEINRFEGIAMILTTFCAISILAHASTKFSIRYDEWGYAATGAVGLFLLLSYASTTPNPFEVKVPFCLFLLSGVVSGYAAHVIDGGKKNA